MWDIILLQFMQMQRSEIAVEIWKCNSALQYLEYNHDIDYYFSPCAQAFKTAYAFYANLQTFSL